ELDLLVNCARDALHDIALYRVAQALRIDDQAAIVRDHHAARPDPPRIALDLDLGHGGHRSAVALGEGDAAPFQQLAAALALRRSSRLPLRLLRRRLDDGGMARLGEVPQAERDRIFAHRRGPLVDARTPGPSGPTPCRRSACPAPAPACRSPSTGTPRRAQRRRRRCARRSPARGPRSLALSQAPCRAASPPRRVRSGASATPSTPC